jgi:hypothetical protein
MPMRKVAPNLCPRKSQAPKATKTGARLTSSVELATEVSPRDRCQRAKVLPRNSPEANSARSSRRADGRPGFPDRRPSISIHANRIGRARRTRQKAVATGPTSLIFTKIGAKAMPAAPASSAAKARLVGTAGPALPSDPSPRERAASPSCSARRYVLMGPFGDAPEGSSEASSPPAAPRRRRAQHEHDPSPDRDLPEQLRHRSLPSRGRVLATSPGVSGTTGGKSSGFLPSFCGFLPLWTRHAATGERGRANGGRRA